VFWPSTVGLVRLARRGTVPNMRTLYSLEHDGWRRVNNVHQLGDRAEAMWRRAPLRLYSENDMHQPIANDARKRCN